MACQDHRDDVVTLSDDKKEMIVGSSWRNACKIVQYRSLAYEIGQMAERVGFEPTVRFPAHTLSKRAP